MKGIPVSYDFVRDFDHHQKDEEDEDTINHRREIDVHLVIIIGQALSHIVVTLLVPIRIPFGAGSRKSMCDSPSHTAESVSAEQLDSKNAVL